MKKTTLFAVSALLVCPSVAEAQSRQDMKALFKALTKTVTTVRKASAKEAKASIWRATHETEYSYNEDESTWEEEAQYYSTFDEKGNVLTNSVDNGDGTKTVRTNTYNENGMVTYQTDEQVAEDGTRTLLTKRSTEYDSIVTNVITKREAQSYDADSKKWYTGNCYTRTITRDGDGNVTSEVIAVPYQGVYDPMQRTTINYKNGKAVTYKMETLTTNATGDEFVWEEAVALKDMVWDRTNGQILGYVSDFYEGDNRLKTANFYATQDDGTEYVYGSLSLEYDEKGGYVALMKELDGYTAIRYSKTFVDDNGSYDYVAMEYEDANSDGKNTADEITSITRQVERFDANGNETLIETYETADDAKSSTDVALVEGTKTEYKYDEATGEVAEAVYSWYDSDTDDYVLDMKVVSDTYVDVANVGGINAVKPNASKASAVYNLQGVRVGDSLDNLPSGLYIQRIGGKTVKTVKH